MHIRHTLVVGVLAASLIGLEVANATPQLRADDAPPKDMRYATA